MVKKDCNKKEIFNQRPEESEVVSPVNYIGACSLGKNKEKKGRGGGDILSNCHIN